MTEKRFKCVSDYDWWGVIDITGEIKGEYDNDCFSTDTVVDLLNELAEEIKELKEKNKLIFEQIRAFRKDYHKDMDFEGARAVSQLLYRLKELEKW